jgi:hypothetical protein
MKRLATVACIVAAALVSTAVASAANGTKLKCFAQAPATCTLGDGAATAYLDVQPATYAGVYVNSWRNTGGTLLSSVSFSFQYYCGDTDSGTDVTSCVTGGSPRWSIPIDTTGDGKTDGYAFVDANNCGATGTVGTGCPVYYDNVGYPSWSAFAEADPTATIGNDVPFVIADQPFAGLIWQVSFTKS